MPLKQPNETITDREALTRIMALTMPGQELYLSEAIDIICDVWNIARLAHNRTIMQALQDGKGK